MIHHLVEWTKHVDAARRVEQMDLAWRLTARAATMFPEGKLDVNQT
jgi:hypothetical protein